MLDQTALQQIGRLALDAVAIAWKAQGHNLTGKAIQELETRVIDVRGVTIIQGYIVDYMANINEGVPASRIPYSPGSGARTSKYISGLIDYVKRRMGKSDREAKSIAFAIASKHKREGMPTKNSARFSSTGKRTGFIEAALEGIEPKLAEMIELAVQESIELVIESFFKTQLGR